MCYWVLPPSRIPIARTTVQTITKEELATREVLEQIYEYDAKNKDKLGQVDEADPRELRLYFEDKKDDELEYRLKPAHQMWTITKPMHTTPCC